MEHKKVKYKAEPIEYFISCPKGCGFEPTDLICKIILYAEPVSCDILIDCDFILFVILPILTF